MRLFYANALTIATLVFAASACSGANRSLPPVVNAVPGASIEEHAGASGVPKGYGILRFRIPVPGRTHSTAPHRVLPAYVSSATQKVAVTVQGVNQPAPTTKTFPCTAVCTGNIVAQLGVNVVTLKLEDKKNRALSRGTSTVVVFKNGTVFDFTLDGVPASVALVPESNVLPVVPASSGYVNFDARDADGNIITPDGHYVDANGNPLIFDLKSSSKSFRLAIKTVSAPGMPIPFSYNGKQHVGKLTLTASAHKSVKTSVSFKTVTIKLVPGIAARISPPIPLQVLGATQVPMPTGSTACRGVPCLNPNNFFVLGNAGGQQVALTFDVMTGSYSVDGAGSSLPGPFVFAPVDLGGLGFSGYYANSPDSNSWGAYDSSGFYGGGSTPCPALYNVPIGDDGSALYCTTFGVPNVYDDTHSTLVAYGLPRKIRTLNGTTYFITANTSTPSQQVYVNGSLTPIAGANTMGANVTAPTTGYYGDSDGTVKTIAGGNTVAKFSHAVENVVAHGSSIYAGENGKVFGVDGPAGTFETGPLQIGNVVEVVTGVKGRPMLVEGDGTLDVMGI